MRLDFADGFLLVAGTIVEYTCLRELSHPLEVDREDLLAWFPSGRAPRDHTGAVHLVNFFQAQTLRSVEVRHAR